MDTNTENKETSLGNFQAHSNPHLVILEELRSLFLQEEKSDIKFKVEDQMIPAHKQVLIQESKYFKNLFNSTLILTIKQSLTLH